MNKNWQKKAVFFFLFMSLLVPFDRSSLLYGQMDCQEQQRNRTAIGLAGVTAAGLAAGIILLGSNKNCCSKHCSHRHHHCSSSSYCSSYSDYTNYTDYTDYTTYSYSDYSDHHHHHNGVSRHFSSSYYDDIGRSMACGEELAAKNNSFSGVFALECKGASHMQGSITPYIQYPDGTTELLDALDLSDPAASVSFGPLKKIGTYALGIRVNQGAVLSSEDADVIVNIFMNGSTVQTSEFSLDPSPGFAPLPVIFQLH